MKKIKVYISTCSKNAGVKYRFAMMKLLDGLKVLKSVEFIELKIPKGTGDPFRYTKKINESVSCADLIIIEGSIYSKELKEEIRIAVEQYNIKVVVLCKNNEDQSTRFRIWTDLRNHPNYSFITYFNNQQLFNVCEMIIVETQQKQSQFN